MWCRIKGCNHLCPCVCELAKELDRIWQLTLNANACAGLLLELNIMHIEMVGMTNAEFDIMQRAHLNARVGRCDGACRRSRKESRPRLKPAIGAQRRISSPLYAGI